MVELKKNEQELTESIMGKINLAKDKEKLGSSVVNLSKCVVNLSKKAGVDIGSTQAQVVFIIDKSGSMSNRYSSGVVQKIVNKIVPLGLTFDDDGNIVCMQFDSSFRMCDDITLANYSDYVNTKMARPGGGTCYSEPLKELQRQFFGKDGAGSKKKELFGRLFGSKSKEDVPASAKTADVNTCPVFVVFITDGACDPSDEKRTDEVIRELSNEMCFVQFIGSSDYSSEKFEYLTRLDDLSSRACDNTGFVRFDDIENVSDTDLYNMLLEQYADWLKVKGF